MDGKVALITGASRGMGKAIALELARAGCDVLLTARDEKALQTVAEEARAFGRKASIYVADLRTQPEPAGLVAGLKRDFGRLDILINNAGGAGRGDFLKLTDDQWKDGFAMKFFAHVRLSRLVWPFLKDSAGSVVAIAGLGSRIPVADYMIGASVVAAVIAFTRALADLGKRDDVQVNVVNPGSVDTDRFKHRLSIIKKSTCLGDAEAVEHHRKELDITRFGKPEDIAGLVAFIVSPRGRWMHGSAIDMDGGQVIPLRMSVYD